MAPLGSGAGCATCQQHIPKVWDDPEGGLGRSSSCCCLTPAKNDLAPLASLRSTQVERWFLRQILNGLWLFILNPINRELSVAWERKAGMFMRLLCPWRLQAASCCTKRGELRRSAMAQSWEPGETGPGLCLSCACSAMPCVSDGSWQSRCKAKSNNEKFGICSLGLWKACSKACGMSPKCLRTGMGKPLHGRQDARLGSGMLVLPYLYNVFFGRIPPWKCWPLAKSKSNQGMKFIVMLRQHARLMLPFHLTTLHLCVSNQVPCKI